MHKVSKKVKVDFNKTFTGTRMKVFQACVSFLSFCFIKDVANISSFFCIFSHNYIVFKNEKFSEFAHLKLVRRHLSKLINICAYHETTIHLSMDATRMKDARA